MLESRGVEEEKSSLMVEFYGRRKRTMNIVDFEDWKHK
jgi:hypothetical protein